MILKTKPQGIFIHGLVLFYKVVVKFLKLQISSFDFWRSLQKKKHQTNKNTGRPIDYPKLVWWSNAWPLIWWHLLIVLAISIAKCFIITLASTNRDANDNSFCRRQLVSHCGCSSVYFHSVEISRKLIRHKYEERRLKIIILDRWPVQHSKLLDRFQKYVSFDFLFGGI